MIQTALQIGPIEGLRIGLFGGSFNPPHSGHFALAETALTRLKLDFIWWMVSPQNPLKPTNQTADIITRLTQTRLLAQHPRFRVTDIECQLNTKTTYQTLTKLYPLLLKAHFVWLTGADSFSGLANWDNWAEIPYFLPIAVFDRPGWGTKALASTPAKRFGDFQLPHDQVASLVTSPVPAWGFVPMPQRSESSTRIRSKNPAYDQALD